ncbi:hypothetical protein ACFPRL_09545 [Pseudoclavibacter helvolus]
MEPIVSPSRTTGVFTIAPQPRLSMVFQSKKNSRTASRFAPRNACCPSTTCDFQSGEVCEGSMRLRPPTA